MGKPLCLEVLLWGQLKDQFSKNFCSLQGSDVFIQLENQTLLSCLFHPAGTRLDVSVILMQWTFRCPRKKGHIEGKDRIHQDIFQSFLSLSLQFPHWLSGASQSPKALSYPGCFTLFISHSSELLGSSSHYPPNLRYRLKNDLLHPSSIATRISDLGLAIGSTFP